MRAVILIAVTAAVTAALRFLPFIVFRKHTPAFITYLGKVLPPALIGMLVIYCFKDVGFTSAPFGLPELIAAAAVVGLQIWKRNAVLSILTATVLYMILIRI